MNDAISDVGVCQLRCIAEVNRVDDSYGKYVKKEAKIDKVEEIIQAVIITKEDEMVIPIDLKETSNVSPALEKSPNLVRIYIKDGEYTKDGSLYEEATPLASKSIEKAESPTAL